MIIESALEVDIGEEAEDIGAARGGDLHLIEVITLGMADALSHHPVRCYSIEIGPHWPQSVSRGLKTDNKRTKSDRRSPSPASRRRRSSSSPPPRASQTSVRHPTQRLNNSWTSTTRLPSRSPRSLSPPGPPLSVRKPIAVATPVLSGIPTGPKGLPTGPRGFVGNPYHRPTTSTSTAHSASTVVPTSALTSAPADATKQEDRMDEDLPYLPITPPSVIGPPSIDVALPITATELSLLSALPTGPKGWGGTSSSTPTLSTLTTSKPIPINSTASAMALKLSATWKEKNILPVPLAPLTTHTSTTATATESTFSAKPSSSASLPTGPRRLTLTSATSGSGGYYDKEMDKEREGKMLLNRYLPKISFNKVLVRADIDDEVSSVITNLRLENEN